MIPSRPLSLVETITETFAIYGRTIGRFALLALILAIPGIVLMTMGASEFATDAIVAARHDINFNDRDLTAFRNEFKLWLAKENPLFAADLASKDTGSQSLDTSSHRIDTNTKGIDTNHSETVSRLSPADSTIAQSPPPTLRADTLIRAKGDAHQIRYYIRTNLSKFSSSILLFGLGCLLCLIGLFALTASVIELACQVFEERMQDVREAIRSAIVWNTWKILFLYLLYTIVMLAVNWIVVFISNVAAGVGAGMSSIITIAQIYVAIRLAATVPALVSEGLSPFAAVRRSWRLTRLNGVRILMTGIVLCIILFFIAMIASMLCGIPFGAVFTLWQEWISNSSVTVSWLLQILPGFIAQSAAMFSITFLILFALGPIFLTIIYYDLRTRADGPLVYME